ncbi:hypothetical protein L6452_03255 [Arctium lappa]|uniref:Uncharacterized protein n=1 Tax=Arctium lappa TaxID=4217 RepID=A0ACB9FML7_ARCLA|nr:hypothetical protein L6452_03255 [Arctium lappa]
MRINNRLCDAIEELLFLVAKYLHLAYFFCHDIIGYESSSSSTIGVDEVVLQKSVIMVRVGNEELNDKRVSSCAIVVKLDDDGNDSDGGRNMVCWICHLSSDQSPKKGVTSVDGKMKESSLV